MRLFRAGINLKPRRGQAVVEMAVFGSLIIVIFAALLSYAQTFTEQQALQQQAFRMALRKAYEDNGFVSYGITKNARFVNPAANFGEGQRSSISAANSVLWSMGEAVSSSYYKINEDEIPSAVRLDTQDSAVTYSGKERKQENAAGIVTVRSAELKDTITTTLEFEDGSKRKIIQGLGPDGRYSQASAGAAITRSRVWETPHPQTQNLNP